MTDTVTIEDPKAVLEALDRAKADAKRFREERDAALAQVDTLQATATALEATANEAATPYKDRLRKAELRNRLLADGVQDVDRLVKYAALESIDIDAEDGPTGIDEVVETLRTDFPEVFDAKHRAQRTKRAVVSIDANAKGEAPRKSGTEQQVDRIFANA